MEYLTFGNAVYVGMLTGVAAIAYSMVMGTFKFGLDQLTLAILKHKMRNHTMQPPTSGNA